MHNILKFVTLFIVCISISMQVNDLVVNGWDGIAFFFGLLNSWLGFYVTTKILQDNRK